MRGKNNPWGPGRVPQNTIPNWVFGFTEVDKGPNVSFRQGFIRACAQHRGDGTEESVLRLTPQGEGRESFLKTLRWEKGDI